MAKTIKFKKQHKKYPEHKDSGGEWSEDIPNDWLIDKLKHVSTLRREKTSIESTSSNYLALENIESFTGKYIESEIEQEPESVTNEFHKGDVLFNKLRPYLAKVFLPDSDGICTGELLVIHPMANKLIPKFLFYRFLSDDFLSTVNNSTYGAKMPRANWEFIRNILIGYPEKENQNAIASYLDQKTSLIDQIIEKKRKLIDLLKEKRTAVINKAVTKGLDPQAKLVDSGVEWIGKVPQGWRVEKLKYLFDFQSGDGFPDELQGQDSGDIPFYKVSDINEEGKYVDKSANYVSIATVNEMNWHLVKENSILLAKIGAALSKNHRKVTQRQACIDNNMLAISTKGKILVGYMYWIWNVINATDFINISSVPSINMGVLKNHLFPFPDLGEQEKASKYLDNETAKVDQIIKQVECSCNLLQEYKSSLISNVVTGKVEV